MEQFYEQFNGCIQRDVPFCQASCPFHIEITDFIEKAGRGVFDAAYKTYRNAVVFPAIVSALCHEPCKEVCPRAIPEAGGRPIELRAIERAVVSQAKIKEPHDYNVPKKPGRVAVIGAGISGLGCALRLAARKYDVEIFESSDRIGGHLWNIADGSDAAGGLTPEIFLEDIEHQLKHENYVLHLNRRISSLEDLISRGFQAVYIATGECGADFDLLTEQDHFRMQNGAACFAGGSLAGKNTIEAIADGLKAAVSIQGFFKTGNLSLAEDKRTTDVKVDPSKLTMKDGPLPDQKGNFSAAEARQEADRCLRCHCDSCRLYCDVVAFSEKWPLRIKEEVFATMQEGAADLRPRPAKRLINTCTHCGLCEEVCPAHIDMDHLFLEARKGLHKLNRMSWAFHDFWIRDMVHANGKRSAVIRAPGKAETARYAFFPGCQLGASEPRYVLDSYQALLDREPDMAMFLHCCGTPIKWAGNQEGHLEALSEIRTAWNGLGRPVLVLACPTCMDNFAEFLPDVEIVSLYEFLEQKGNLLPTGRSDGRIWSVFDPCSSTGKKGLRNAVRGFVEAACFQTEPLPVQEAHSACCSFGGQVSTVNTLYRDFVVDRRISESSNPYITYCINCRDIFSGAGKQAIHILDILFGKGAADIPVSLPTVTERRENREKLKRQLLKDFWEEEMQEKEPEFSFAVIIDDDLRSKMDRDHILTEDVYKTIDFCERTERRVRLIEKGTVSGYHQIGYMTYWVEYRPINGNAFELVNIYCHRMKIELEAIWNGKKIDIDV